MNRSSPFKRLAACISVLAFACAQVAMAAFAPQAAKPDMAVHMAMEGDCHGMDAATKHVCAKSCQAEPQKHEVPSLAAMPPAADPGLRVEAVYLAPASCEFIAQPVLARATAPPLAVLYARFLK